MKLISFFAYLRENRLRFCEVQCWSNILPCEKCLFILTLHSFAVNKKYQKLQYTFENSIFKDELTEIYRKHFKRKIRTQLLFVIFFNSLKYYIVFIFWDFNLPSRNV